MSTTTHDADKSALLTQAIEVARSGRGSGGPPHDSVDALLLAYYRRVATEDIAERSDVDVYGAFASHYRLAGTRPQGTARVRVFTPGPSDQGWSADGHSVVEVVVDDMPFLVDSLTMELSRQLHDVHLVIHPLFDVVRDITGTLQEVRPVAVGDAEVDEGEGVRESWMHVEIDRIPEDEDVAALEDSIQRVLRDVREAVEDWDKMHEQVAEIVRELDADPPTGVDRDEVKQTAALLQWLGDAHFTFLGYREYRLEQQGADEYLRGVPGTGLGILRADQDMGTSSGRLPAAAAAKAREKTLLVLTKANSRSTVHRPAYLDYVGVKKFENGEVVGERRFLGLYSSAAYTESLTRIPLLRERAAAVLNRIGFEPMSHDGKALMDTLETYPRDELFHTTVDELAPMAEQAMHARERRQLRIFIRRDTYGRYVSVLVYLPRDRYNTTVRERFSEILRERLGGESVEFTVRLTESTTARVHFVVHPAKGTSIPEEVDTADLERRMADASRSWRDDFTTAVIAGYGEEDGARLARGFHASFPEAYKEDFSPRIAAADVGRLEALHVTDDRGGIDLSLYEDLDAGRGEARLKVFRVGSPLSLSQVLPMLSSMGVEVVDERPYELDGLDRPTYIYEFGLRYGSGIPDKGRELFHDAIRAVWDGFNEIDGFNALVLAAGLTWRQATLLRAYAKYMRQGGSPFALDYIEEALLNNVDITRLLVRLFEARFDPSGAHPGSDRSSTGEEGIEERIARALDDVASLDHDRILRSYLTHVRATLRTNYFQPAADGGPKPYISLKLEPDAIPDLPAPRPKYEIFVYSPRVEGSHLRFGAVARGGLRWSDRRDDFRTEVLGLVKAQMVKNTVIVPVGAKGAFFCKQLPPVDPAQPGDRDAWLAEGVACYTTFISGLLDITDNLVDGATVPPRDVVRHDGDDSYLVVAADKGTATFSDIANGVSKDYGFWLGDAFASGGSVGYDHKAMGITARGAWVSVQRHFRERGIDCQTEEFTCVGIGDMSGDVFGNGLLCSEKTLLVAAFDHRDIFVDPTPDAAASYAERKRLFDLPRSSWQDYDKDLISAGGGVYSRSLKRIPIDDAVRTALGIRAGVDAMTPGELMSAILKAPVDLLWNGGIGTYVKGSSESHADAGDKANDGIRVDGRDVRARSIGEGGNLGLTQLGRIEYSREGSDGVGGRMNTDFIDNSAGVDTSDHEVNLKILLDRVVKDGDLTEKQRNHLLAEMTDEVAALVLRDNYEQNIALANALDHAASMLHVHEEWMGRLERDGFLDRELEGLPSAAEVRRREDNGEGLTAPELSVLLAWTKIVLEQELLDSDLPDDPYLDLDLRAYFPTQVREGFGPQVEQHPLRREIIVTQVVNDLVNGAGMTYWPRLAGETGATAGELTRANFVAREIFGSLDLRRELMTFDNQLDAALQTRMRLEMRTLVERASRWLVNNRRPPLDSAGTVELFSAPVQRTMAELPELMSGRELAAYVARKESLEASGVPEALASRIAVLPPAYMLLGVMEIATREDVEPAVVTRVHFALGERLGLPGLVQRILALPRADRWQTMARAALRDDLHAVHAQLTGQVLARTSADDSAAARIAAWEDAESVVVPRAVATLEEICTDDAADLARLSVGLRVVRGLLASG